MHAQETAAATSDFVKADRSYDPLQDELLDTVYWMRQIIALLCGIIWGGIPLKGLPAFIA
jgi:hypothetical protein